MHLKTWPEQERPREKLLAHGAPSLTDSELLALLLNSGTKHLNALELAVTLLQSCGSLRNLLNRSFNEFNQQKGVGPAKYCILQAAVELTKRYLSEPMIRCGLLRNIADAKSFLHTQLRDYAHEVFYCIFLDAKKRILHSQIMFEGTLCHTAIYPREIIKKALSYNTASLIVAHNHPSGSYEPSPADLKITQALHSALKTVGIELLDHIIVGDDEALSLAEQGLLALPELMR